MSISLLQIIVVHNKRTASHLFRRNLLRSYPNNPDSVPLRRPLPCILGFFLRSCLIVSSMLTTVVVIRALNPTSLTSPLLLSRQSPPAEHLFQDRSHQSCNFQEETFYNILANIMNISFYGSKNDFIFSLLALTALGKFIFQNCKCYLCCIGTHQKLW